MAEDKRPDIVFVGRARSTGKMRNDIVVGFVTMNEHYHLATDERPFHGGDGTSPPPLALFAAALTGCLMTQIRAFSKRLDVPLRGCEVSARLHWHGVQQGRDPCVSEPVSFSVGLDAGEVDQVRLIQAAKTDCFIEQSLAKGVIVGHRLRPGDGWRHG